MAGLGVDGAGAPTLKGAAGGLTAGVLATEEAERRIRTDGSGDRTVGTGGPSYVT